MFLYFIQLFISVNSNKLILYEGKVGTTIVKESTNNENNTSAAQGGGMKREKSPLHSDLLQTCSVYKNFTRQWAREIWLICSVIGYQENIAEIENRYDLHLMGGMSLTQQLSAQRLVGLESPPEGGGSLGPSAASLGVGHTIYLFALDS